MSAPRAADRGEFLWRPDAERVADAHATRLMARLGVDSAERLRAFSFERTADFWDAVVDDLELEFDAPYSRTFDDSQGREWVRWFVDGKLNVARVCLDRWAADDGEARALTWESERGERRELSWTELRRLADGVARALADAGVGGGHTVGLFMPMTPEAVAAYYACAKLGAIAMPIFSGFGPEAVATRLRDADARVLITADGFPRAGKEVEMKLVADRACELAPAVERVLVLRRLGADVPWDDRRDIAWEDAVSDDPDPFDSLSLDASHPLELMYTSGTTGRPKGALHTHGGMLAVVARDAAYGLDLRRSDILTWPTDLGWIMGPWTIIAAGVLGTQLCLIEGSPMAPLTRLFESVQRSRTTVLGIGPSLVRALMSAGERDLRSRYDLSSLRVLGTGGEPVPPDAYEWLLREIGGDECPIVNLSGGTEVGGCFLIPLPSEGLKASTLGGPALGMDIAVFDQDGEEVGPNQVGELVCRSIWPGMTQGLWKDPDRFLETYWSRFPGVWTHGDWASFDSDGQWFLHGRSDDTLNVAGQRLGPAEVEAAVLAQPGVLDAAVVPLPHPIKGEAIWAFVVAEPEAELAPEELADAVAGVLGKPFRPERVVLCGGLPRTRSGKIVRRAIRATALGEDPGDLSTLEDPETIEAIRAAVS